ncbi:MAG: hypothetical protein ACXVGR_13280, partial [Mycobacteriaceae bacterium]
ESASDHVLRVRVLAGHVDKAALPAILCEQPLAEASIPERRVSEVRNVRMEDSLRVNVARAACT